MIKDYSTSSENYSGKFEPFDKWWDKHWHRDIQPTSNLKNACRFAYNDAIAQAKKLTEKFPCENCLQPMLEDQLIEMKWTGYDRPSNSPIFVCARCSDSFLNAGSASEVL